MRKKPPGYHGPKERARYPLIPCCRCKHGQVPGYGWKLWRCDLTEPSLVVAEFGACPRGEP